MGYYSNDTFSSIVVIREITKVTKMMIAIIILLIILLIVITVSYRKFFEMYEFSLSINRLISFSRRTFSLSILQFSKIFNNQKKRINFYKNF